MNATKLQQEKPIFWKGIKVQYIMWNTLNFGGKLKIRLNNHTIEVDILELYN